MNLLTLKHGDGTTRIFKLDLPSNEDLETSSEPIKSDFDMALEDAELDFDNLDLNTIIDKDKLLTEPPIKIEDKIEGSYTPAEREQMDRLNNIETIDTESSN